ncbi:4-hydroxy-tetrahydrodipicolinate synthase [Halomonas piscis]|uniref:4-hydroxy-tetrahydrodipicolinate synthase n=1 Tax=Halomonas piscis TaxID=3031727 RepID=A0ABY9YZ42_9GAMM|nr:4-hydroxy-tetrahydrodipicolinate synthase [Halomonas piscis]WNK19745.1 4-hydroxy-tetrahydrodipicolinate synthase [Halomonas piscis]
MKLNGILVPIVTPFGADGSVDFDALKALVAKFLDAGVGGVVACGTTGEYYALDESERDGVLRTVRNAVGEQALAVAGINSLSTGEAVKRAKQAEALGYEVLMLAPPAYVLPNQDEIVAHYEEVAVNTALPIVLYNFPDRSAVNIEIDTVARLAKMPKIIGIKESSGDFSRAIALMELNDESFQVVCGSDDQAADYLFWGARSWISGGANVFPAEQVQMLKAAEQGDWDQVRAIMRAMMPAIRDMEGGDYNQKAKLGCMRHGIDVGQVRLPLCPVSDADARSFVDSLSAVDHQ